jgi:hypothetical protein
MRIRFDLVDGRLVLVFSLDSLVPVTCVALLPVELSSFEEGAGVDARGDGDGGEGLGNVDGDDVPDEDNDEPKQQKVDSLQKKGRCPFSYPPLPPPAPASRDGEPSTPPPKSYMLLVGYNQVD